MFLSINGESFSEALAPLISDKSDALKVAARYPAVLNDYWLRTAADEPALLAQALPDLREITEEIPTDTEDPFEELGAHSPIAGLVHRFPDRVLVIVSEVCAMRCRHCTRKNLLGLHHVPDDEEIEKIRDYITGDGKIREVLLSGGDPLMLSDELFLRRLEAFTSLPQIYSVRIGTRIPCVYPMRITDDLVAAMGKSKKVWINTHFNHPKEITKEAETACAKLVDAGIPVSCQTVLLKGINDNPDTLELLFRELQRIRVRPYYAFAGDPVKGTAHFRVTREEARLLERTVAGRIGGLALPRFVVDDPAAMRKEPV